MKNLQVKCGYELSHPSRPAWTWAKTTHYHHGCNRDCCAPWWQNRGPIYHIPEEMLIRSAHCAMHGPRSTNFLTGVNTSTRTVPTTELPSRDTQLSTPQMNPRKSQRFRIQKRLALGCWTTVVARIRYIQILSMDPLGIYITRRLSWGRRVRGQKPHHRQQAWRVRIQRKANVPRRSNQKIFTKRKHIRLSRVVGPISLPADLRTRDH